MEKVKIIFLFAVSKIKLLILRFYQTFFKRETMNFKKLLLSLLIVASLAGFAYFKYFTPNVQAHLPDDGIVKVPTGANIEQVISLLLEKKIVKDEASLRFWVERLDYKGRGGRFKIQPNWSSYALVKHLRSGEQAAVRVILNNEKSPTHVAAKVGKLLEADSTMLISAFHDKALLDSLGLKPETLMSIFIPNTYEFYWNTTGKGFVEKMLKEHKRFWNETRLNKARTLNLSPAEVYTMASIVEGETNSSDERPKVAGVYLNRLAQGMKLQADPTVQFGLMQLEKTTQFRRLYNKDYQTAHPYNTYLITGMPPGPIGMASVASLEAVLNREPHNYVFFCAKPDDSGRHTFAETYEAHLINVKLYQQWLKEHK